MRIHTLHDWDLAPAAAIAWQTRLAAQLRDDGGPAAVRLIAGVDMAIAGDRGVAAAVVLSWPELAVVETRTAWAPIPFPYVPGLLSFREIPVLVEVLARLQHEPDLVCVDGQGRLHPRGVGLACHLGLVLDKPTVGFAKSRLCGEHAEPGRERGAWAPVQLTGRVQGACLRTRRGVRPLYVSAGHRLDLATAVAWALRLSPRYRVPEPTRQADRLAALAKRQLPSR